VVCIESLEAGRGRHVHVLRRWRRGYVSWIASVHEGGGIQIILNFSYGEIIEDHIRCQQLGPLEVEPFFADLKESYRSLKLIECEGRVTMAVDEMIQERCNIACEEDTRAQTQHWGAGFDICI
jgi:hypothetical protein